MKLVRYIHIQVYTYSHIITRIVGFSWKVHGNLLTLSSRVQVPRLDLFSANILSFAGNVLEISVEI
jgi:hypothetical protein